VTGFTRRQTVIGAAGLAAIPNSAHAAFPTRPLTIMAPANPGGAWDVFARTIQSVARQENLSPVPMEVLNRGGAGGTIGLADLVARRRGDPNIIMVTGSVMMSSSIAHNSPVRLAAATPIAKFLTDYLAVAVPTASPYQSMADLAADIRRSTGEVSWCGGSAGGIDHMVAASIVKAAGGDLDKLRYVAYAGGGEASAAILGGKVKAAVNGFSEWNGLRNDGRVRYLAVSAPHRLDKTTPTLREAGFDVVMENWRGLMTAPGLSPEEHAWWINFARRLQGNKTWQDIRDRYQWNDAYAEGPDFGRFIAEEEKKAAVLLADLSITSGSGGYAAVGPWAFPTGIGVVAAVAAGAVVLESRTAAKATVVKAETTEPEPDWKRGLAGLAATAAYLAALSVAGFLIATPIFIFAVCLLIGSKAHIRDGIVAIALSIAVWLLFSRVLHITLPSGLLA